jgi:hypothetical protein
MARQRKFHVQPVEPPIGPYRWIVTWTDHGFWFRLWLRILRTFGLGDK